MAHQTTTTIWSKPTTEKEIQYFSRMAGFRRLMVWAINVLIVLCMFLDFAGVLSLSKSTIGLVTDNQIILYGIPILLLIVLHAIARKALETYLYYKWDKDPETNISPAYFIVTYLAILLMGLFGSINLFTGFVKPVSEKDKGLIDTRVKGLKDEAKSDYDAAINAANAAFDSAKKAANSTANAAIAAQNKRRQKTPGDRAVVAKAIKNINAEKDAAIAKAESEKAAAISEASSAQNAAFEVANNEHTAGIKETDTHNQNEKNRYSSEEKKAHGFAYLINVLVLLITIMMIRQKVKIDALSGIFPIRSYTDLDAHGGVLAQAATVFTDIFNLQALNLLSNIHRAGVPKQVNTFDGQILFKQTGKESGKDEEKGAF